MRIETAVNASDLKMILAGTIQKNRGDIKENNAGKIMPLSLFKTEVVVRQGSIEFFRFFKMWERADAKQICYHLTNALWMCHEKTEPNRWASGGLPQA